MYRGGWTEVSYKKRFAPKWDTFPFGGRNRNPSASLGEVTSLFVSDFPEGTTAKDLFQLFGCYGSVVEVAISPRRNSFGKRFGFARFVEVIDGRLLAVRLDNIIIGGKKIHVNLPRFKRDSYRRVKGHGEPVLGKIGVPRNRFHPASNGIPRSEARKGHSYAEVVGGSHQDNDSKVSENMLVLQSSEALRGRLERAFVGKVRIPGSAHIIQTQFEMEGVFAVKVSPMGSNWCLLEENEEGFIEDLIGEGEVWWKTWFLEIKKWEPGAVDQHRDVWIRIYGIPLHAWSSDCFTALAE
ncbi:uncharacterized protein LOC131619480 [Vicia villosa]|uniref:uncharacterized protein LOC131619480 n=1 Tax=Vicia villosa TaxID=3911 RepID=UPI00273C8C8B|nr:uncharacterized protein LOC131619480 [Vicia villosa]